MTNQEIVQVLSTHGEVQAIFVNREATSNQLIAHCLGLGELGENEFQDWKIIVLPRDYHSGIQDYIEPGQEPESSSDIRILNSSEKVFDILDDIRMLEQETSLNLGITDVHTLSQYLHRPRFRLVNIKHHVKISVLGLNSTEEKTEHFYISEDIEVRSLIELLLDKLEITKLKDGTGTISNLPLTHELLLVKLNQNNQEEILQLGEKEIIWKILLESTQEDDIISYSLQLKPLDNWLTKVGSLTSRFTQSIINTARPSTMYSLFSGSTTSIDGSTTPKYEPSTPNQPTRHRRQITEPSRMVRHISLSGKDAESGVDFSTITTWISADVGRLRRKISQSFDSTNDPASTFPQSRNGKERSMLFNLTGEGPNDQFDEPSEMGDTIQEIDQLFSQVLDELNIKDNVREKMMDFTPEKKLELIEQNEMVKKMKSVASPNVSSASVQSTPITRAKSTMSIYSTTNLDQVVENVNESLQDENSLSPSKSTLQPNNSGGAGITSYLFGSIFNSSQITHQEGTIEYYLELLSHKNLPHGPLYKCLQSLRITLATVSVSWVRQFVEEGQALISMEQILGKILEKKSTNKYHDHDEDIQLELIRCLRALLNTEPGFDQVLKSTCIIKYLTFSLNTNNHKLRNIVAEVLSAVCVLSPKGHATVLESLTDFKFQFNETYRFEYLLNSLKAEVSDEGISAMSAYEYKTTCLILVNALVNSPDELDDRMLLRDEFKKRGLLDIFKEIQDHNLPDSLVKQIECYMDEMEQDHIEIKEQILVDALQSDSDHPLLNLSDAIKLIPENSILRTVVSEIANYLSLTLTQEIPDEVKYEVINLIDKFIFYCSNFYQNQNWPQTLKPFFDETRALVNMSPRDILELDPSFVNEIKYYKEIEVKLGEVQSDYKLKEDELTKLKELPVVQYLLQQESKDAEDLGKGPKDQLTNLVQKLVAKEKEISQLTDQVEALSSGSLETKDSKDDQENKWGAIKKELDEKIQENTKLFNLAKDRAKEIAYLKRTLEAVCTKFKLSLGELTTGGTSSDPISITDIPSNNFDTSNNNQINDTSKPVEPLPVAEALPDNSQELKLLQDSVLMLKIKVQEQKVKLKEKDLEIEQLKTNISQNPKQSPLLSHFAKKAGSVDSIAPLPATSQSIQGMSSIPPPPPLPQAGANIPPPPPLPGTQFFIPPPPPLPHPGVRIPPPPPLPGTQSSIPPPPPPMNVAQSEGASQIPSLPPGAIPCPPPPPPGYFGENGIPVPPPPMAPFNNINGIPTPPNPIQASELAAAIRKKQGPKPKGPMKPIFWTKLPSKSIPNSIWDQVEEERILPNLNLVEIEDLFGKKIIHKSFKRGTGPKTKTKQMINLLELNRSQNICISLAKIKIPYTAIKLAILELDDSRLSVDNLRSLQSCCPSSEEIKLISNYQGSIEELGNAEKYIYQVMHIPRLEQRIKSMIFRRRFEMEVEEIRPELTLLNQSISEVKQSLKLINLLETVLAIGNFMNHSTPRGNALGFKLGNLTLLKEVRATIDETNPNNIPTLLHYLAWISPDQTWFTLDDLKSDLPHLEAAARVSISNLLSSINSLSQGVQSVMSEIKIQAKLPNKSENDRFVLYMENFITIASEIVESIEESKEALESNLAELLKYFAEDNSQLEDIFNILIHFIKAYDSSKAENEKSKKKLQKAQATPTISTPKTPNYGQGDFDFAVRELKSGLRRQRTQRPRSGYYSPSNSIKGLKMLKHLNFTNVDSSNSENTTTA